MSWRNKENVRGQNHSLAGLKLDITDSDMLLTFAPWSGTFNQHGIFVQSKYVEMQEEGGQEKLLKGSLLTHRQISTYWTTKGWMKEWNETWEGQRGVVVMSGHPSKLSLPHSLFYFQQVYMIYLSLSFMCVSPCLWFSSAAALCFGNPVK